MHADDVGMCGTAKPLGRAPSRRLTGRLEGMPKRRDSSVKYGQCHRFYGVVNVDSLRPNRSGRRQCEVLPGLLCMGLGS